MRAAVPEDMRPRPSPRQRYASPHTNTFSSAEKVGHTIFPEVLSQSEWVLRDMQGAQDHVIVQV